MKKYWNKPLCIAVLCGLFSTATTIAFAQGFTPNTPIEAQQVSLDLAKVFSGSPIIYSILFFLSMVGCVLWIYSLISLKSSEMAPQSFLDLVEEHIAHKRYDAAATLCQENHSLSASVLQSGLRARMHGPKAVMEAMEAEGKRQGLGIWQRISLLNDIAHIAPMLGLLGTVVGMFYAFYDVNRSTESLSYIFDGLGIAIGTTVSGLIVAILAVVFFTTLKFRLVRLLSFVEQKTISIGSRIDSNS